MNKYYVAFHGFRDNISQGRGGDVYVVRNDGTEDAPRALRFHSRHSPTGWAWGYGGSGPSQLALDILWDFLGREPSPSLYHAFKDTFIAMLDQDKGFRINGEDISAWMVTRESTVPNGA